MLDRGLAADALETIIASNFDSGFVVSKDTTRQTFLFKRKVLTRIIKQRLHYHPASQSNTRDSCACAILGMLKPHHYAFNSSLKFTRDEIHF